MSISRYTDRMDIFIEEAQNRILIRLDWKYEWLDASGQPLNWSYQERLDFHNAADNLIWSMWGGQFQIRTRGTSSFAQKYTSASLNVNFDIRWVLSGEHWNVKVSKIPSGQFAGSSVNWGLRTITLDSEDILLRTITRNGTNHFQYPIAHEFGHAIGNSIHAPISSPHGDEYRATSTFNGDNLSMMHWGGELRTRHMDYIISELNQMISNTTFYVHSV